MPPTFDDDIEDAFALDLRRMPVTNWPNLIEAARAPFRTPASPMFRIWQRVRAVDALLDFYGRMARLAPTTQHD